MYHELVRLHDENNVDVLEYMRALAENVYCDYIGQLLRDECLGWEIKVERGKFGKAELEAHCVAAEKLGRHRALHEAARMLEEALCSNERTDQVSVAGAKSSESKANEG